MSQAPACAERLVAQRRVGNFFMTSQIIVGDCIESLRTLPDESVHCCVTSPPYWGLRDYGVVALETGRKAILLELNPAYADIARRRIDATTPGLAL